jgi:hypothetical protein
MPKMLANLPTSGVINVSCGACPPVGPDVRKLPASLRLNPTLDRRVDVIWSCSYPAIYDAHV